MWTEVDDAQYEESRKRTQKRDTDMLKKILTILLWLALADVIFGPLGLIVGGIICIKKYL